MNREEEYIGYYKKSIEIYEREDFKDIISKKKLLNVKNCYNEYLYWYEHPEWPHKIFRCKKSFCPICDMKNKRMMYYKHKDRALKLEKKYNLFILVLNGNNVEIKTDKINKEIKDNNEKLKILLSRPFIEKVVRGYFKVIEINYTYYDSLPHIHIILFTIRGIYKHFKMSEFKNMITQEWRNLKGFNANVYLKSLGTKENLEPKYLEKNEKLIEAGKNPKTIKNYEDTRRFIKNGLTVLLIFEIIGFVMSFKRRIKRAVKKILRNTVYFQ